MYVCIYICIYIIEKKYKTFLLSTKLEPVIMLIASSLLIPKMNSGSIFLNIYNSNIIKAHSFLH